MKAPGQSGDFITKLKMPIHFSILTLLLDYQMVSINPIQITLVCVILTLNLTRTCDMFFLDYCSNISQISYHNRIVFQLYIARK